MRKEYTLAVIARAIDAVLIGDGSRVVTGMAPIAEAGPGKLCFADSAKQHALVNRSSAEGVIVGEDFPDAVGMALLRVRDPRLAFVQVLEMFRNDDRLQGIHPTAVVGDDVRLGADVGIGPMVVVEPGARLGDGCQVNAGTYIGHAVEIGADCQIGPNCNLMADTRIGARCILHAGVVLGSDGYGYQWQGDHHHKIPQLGRVVIGDDVEIGANTCIDRATLGETRIGAGTKLDNLVHIAHNNVIGRHAMLTAQVGIAGSSRLGDGVIMGGQSGVADHMTVGDGVQISGQAGVLSDLQAGEKVWGTPARQMGRAMREQVLIGKLPETQREMRQQGKTLEALVERVAELERKLADS